MNIDHEVSADPALKQEPRSISKGGFAKLVNVSPGRVSQMITAGMPVESDGKIDVARGKLWIVENINPTRAASQAQGATLFGEEKQSVSLTAERARLAKAQADAVELKNAAMRRELVPAVEVERMWAGEWMQMRSSVLAVPSRLRQLLPDLTAADIEIIDGELRRMLTEFGNDQ
ncbi:DNA packaging protein [Brucella pituitosa]|uniref:DNA packaging protein n=1 Tax=Brucella pituitosa TaxID=571256 RepID=UPI000D00C2B4|nr:DNA packaging protein [Ochrobactrum sp. MYb68]